MIPMLAERLGAEGKCARVALWRSQLALNLANYPDSIRAATKAIAWAISVFIHYMLYQPEEEVKGPQALMTDER